MNIEQAIAEMNEKRGQMSLKELVEDIESRHFRTAHDTGANLNALMIWNMVRGAAGMPRLTIDDLWNRHAEDQGWDAEALKREKDFWKAYRVWSEQDHARRTYEENGGFKDIPKSQAEFFQSRNGA